MSKKTLARMAHAAPWLVLISAAIGCDDGSPHTKTGRDSGEEEPEEDGGGDDTPDGGEDENDGGDTESDGGEDNTPPTLTNAAGATCAPVALLSPGTWAEACWVDEEETICGLDASQLPGVDGSAGCVAQDVEGVTSDYCGAFFDQVDGVEDGALSITNSGIQLTFAGCCLPTGECGAALSEPLKPSTLNAHSGEPFSLHLGCASVAQLLAVLGDALDVGTEPPAQLPFCDPESGGAPTSGRLPGVPAFVCGCGEDTVDDETGLFPCLDNLPVAVCGADEPTDAQLAQIPEFICGAVGGPTTALPTMPNVAASVCGTLAITTAGPLALFPEIVCGCGDAVRGNGSCLPNVPPTLCGGVAFVGTSVPATPDYLCGCGEGVPSLGRPCVSNIPNTVCGALANADPVQQAGLPAYICGCGVGNAYDPTSPTNAALPCLSNRDGVTCGSAQPANGQTIPGIPQTLCGCGVDDYDTRNAFDGLCIPHVSPLACGALAPSSALLLTLPPFICGCGATRSFESAPCMNYLPTSTCGTHPTGTTLEPNAEYESDFYHFRTYFAPTVLGCGPTTQWTPPATGNDWQASFCFSNSDTYRHGEQI